MPLDESRAFCLAEGGMPAIVLNSSDAVHGRIFSLFHEYAHLLLGASAMCMPQPGAHAPHGRRGSTERFCDRFAGALLVPKEALLSQMGPRSAPAAREQLDEVLRAMSAVCKVSRQVILHRLLAVHAVPRAVFEAEMRELEAQKAPPRRPRRGGLPAARRCLQQKGGRFVDLVLQAQSRDLITCSDVADYLSIKVKNIGEVESLLGR
jgi:Zn-dependent peptidase ImmA (M78 family)